MKLLPWVVVCATSIAAIVLANLTNVGPYFIDLDTFMPCREKGTILVESNVKLVYKNDRAVYEGNLTFPYDVDDEDLLTTITVYEWGSTGGWFYFYGLEKYDIMQFLMTNFPVVFETTFGSMGITGKPMKAGTYHVENFRPMGIKLKKFPVLDYGRYKLEAIQSRNGTELCCFEFESIVTEDYSRAAVPGFLKRVRHLFG